METEVKLSMNKYFEDEGLNDDIIPTMATELGGSKWVHQFDELDLAKAVDGCKCLEIELDIMQAQINYCNDNHIAVSAEDMAIFNKRMKARESTRELVRNEVRKLWKALMEEES